MGAKVIGSMISCAMLTFLVLVTISFYIFSVQEERVNDVCYDFAEVLSTKNEFSEELFSLFSDSVSKYGDYKIDIMLETTTADGYPDIFYGFENVVGKELKRGDTVTLAVYDLNPSLLEKLVGKSVRSCAIKRAVIE